MPSTFLSANKSTTLLQTWVQGQLDYAKLKGQTGPLVYPAGQLLLLHGRQGHLLISAGGSTLSHRAGTAHHLANIVHHPGPCLQALYMRTVHCAG